MARPGDARKAAGGSGVERLSVNVSGEIAVVVRRLAAKSGSVTEAIRRSVLTEDFLEKAVADGYSIRLHKRGMPTREVVFTSEGT